MAPDAALGQAATSPLRGELRYGLELARLVTDREFLRPRHRADAPPVILVPGFMAGDQSLGILTGWLRRRGSRTAAAGIRLNVDCAERAMAGIEQRLRELAADTDRRIVLVGQSRGGTLARVAAVRHPELVSAVVMLGSPVLDPLEVGPAVLRTVRTVARLGDFGVPGVFSTRCRDGECCAAFHADLKAPLPDPVRGVAVYSRSDGIVSWRSCLDPYADCVEVESTHTGMSVNLAVYRILADTLEETGRRDRTEDRWSG